MSKFKKLSLAVGVTLASAAGSVAADPTFGDGLNEEFFRNFENIYRPVDNCSAEFPCLDPSVFTAPTGWAIQAPAGAPVSPTGVSGAFVVLDPAGTPAPVNSLLVGDVFVGILDVQGISADGVSTWFSTATDQFTGYFAQEVLSIGFDESPDIDHVQLGVAASDPFGILNQNGATGEMLRLYTDDGTAFESNGTVLDDITKATDGTFWAALGLSAADATDANGLGDPFGTLTDGFAYTHADLSLSQENFSDQETFLALNVVTLGPSYNKGTLAPINDVNENEAVADGGGGVATAPISGTCLSLGAAACTHFVGTGEIEANTRSILFGGTSPWFFASNDPFLNFRQQVPEPGVLALFGLGLVGLGGLRRRTKRG